ncbi:aryl-sulfate sulfotransferase [Shewanella sp. KX20019]|uniref:aryl-sulfate sulfotransferase n=1 Tax=Shewanella sp. KX20019 TaxID=2803864 RepID=UPI0019279848|nr:aryl-sulfate sulfotransferase [Shewanella sp. KX20019]QQX80467.1 aryl-sulfate sulfotransferase [Shewanella sp. KX20019]
MKKTILAAALAATALTIAMPATAGKFNAIKPPPAQGQLGSVIVNPYGLSPQTAVIDLGGYEIDYAEVIVHGKGKDGVDIKYDAHRETILNHNGVPVFGLYADYDNQVTLKYNKDGNKVEETYSIWTLPQQGGAVVNGVKANFPEVTVKKVDPEFEDRLYLMNYLLPVPGSYDITWKGGMGAMEWDRWSFVYILDTKGETRWALDTKQLHDVKNINKRGIMMGFHQTDNGDIVFGQGQKIYRMDMFGKMVFEWDLPRGYQDFSHDMQAMPNGHYLVRAAKTDYLRHDGKRVHTVRDHILEMDATGKLVEVWDLNKILDNMRDAQLIALDAGAVCLNIDSDKLGKKAKIEPDAPFGDIPGVGAGRNWAHVNSVEYDAADDSIILSLRHQGNVKIGRDKEVKWILSPSIGWEGDLADKLLTPVDSDGDKIECTEKGYCADSDFDFTYTQHTTWLNGKTYSDGSTGIVSFDNGDGRHMDQPALPTMKYSRAVEYKINEDDMTVEQTWEYGKDRGYEWYSVVTSNVSYEADKNSMFTFSANTDLATKGKRSGGVLNEIKDGTQDVAVEMQFKYLMPRNAAYRALIIRPDVAVK